MAFNLFRGIGNYLNSGPGSGLASLFDGGAAPENPGGIAGMIGPPGQPPANPGGLAGLFDAPKIGAFDPSVLGGGAAAIAPLLGPQRRRVSTGQILAALGGGLAQGRQAAEQQAQQRQAYGIDKAKLQAQFDEADEKRRAAAQRRQQIDAYRQSLPAEERLKFDADPETYTANAFKPKEFSTVTTEGGVFSYDPTAGALGNRLGDRPQPARGEGGAGGGVPGLFGGNSVQAQSLNYLVNSGQLTPQQAANIAAGRPITGPNGEVYFATPLDLVGGGAPASGGAASGAPAPSVAQVSAEQAPPVAGQSAQAGNGLHQITQPKARPPQQAILETDSQVQAAETALSALQRALELNDQAYSGPMAGAQQTLARVAPFDIPGVTNAAQATATTEFENLILNQALANLRPIFGTNPTEGERKIALELAGSKNLSKAERERIIRNAIAATQGRLQIAQQRAAGLRDGSYFQPGGGSAPSPAPQPAAPVPSGGQNGTLPSTPPPPETLQAGQVYQTPRGPLRWLGDRWQEVR